MAKAEWVNLSQDSGSGDASIAVSSHTPHTGREARTSILTWVSANFDPIERTVIQEGFGPHTEPDRNSIKTQSYSVKLWGTSNEQGLGFRAGGNSSLPIIIDRTFEAAGLIINTTEGGVSEIDGDPGRSNMYRFSVGFRIDVEETTSAPPPYHINFVIVGASGKTTTVRVEYIGDAVLYLRVEEGDITISADGGPTTVAVESNTDWNIE